MRTLQTSKLLPRFGIFSDKYNFPIESAQGTVTEVYEGRGERFEHLIKDLVPQQTLEFKLDSEKGIFVINTQGTFDYRLDAGENVIVYTGDPDVNAVLESIARDLRSKEHKLPSYMRDVKTFGLRDEDTEDISLTKGPTKSFKDKPYLEEDLITLLRSGHIESENFPEKNKLKFENLRDYKGGSFHDPIISHSSQEDRGILDFGKLAADFGLSLGTAEAPPIPRKRVLGLQVLDGTGRVKFQGTYHLEVKFE
ncbi:MAG: hypothetical protein V3V78_03980 [Candidatus Woesearchaeota archaeon]